VSEESTSDEILMAAYQAGNRAAFEELFDRHGGSIYGFLARRLGDPGLAEDLYQEVFLRLHRARKTYDPRRPFRAWLFAIVHNLLNDALRQQMRTPRMQSLDALPQPGSSGPAVHPEPAAALPSSVASAESITSTRQAATALSAALRELPADEATVLILARLEGLSYDEIGSVIGRTEAAAKQLAYRALKRVRAGMAAAGHGEDT
jgi:RNA polymerase sigma-70 factor (ECF subfamily)